MTEAQDSARPRTTEQLCALPIGPAFGMSDEIVNGQMVRIPIAPAIVAFYSAPTDLISWTDADGAWTLGRYADGRWYRQRA